VRIPKVWVSADEPTTWPDGSRQVVRAFGWSDGDIAEARVRATEAVKRLAERIRAGQEFPERYSYADRPVREEIIPARELSLGPDRALVTRNADGCLVLNTAGVMFVDVDVPEPGLFARLFGKKKADELHPALVAWIEQNPRSKVRVYRTHSGWRYLMMHDQFDPTSAGTRDLLVALGADRKYVELTRIQESFRARLTPKPWRLDFPMHAPGIRFPRETSDAERDMKEWLAEYEPHAESYATTRFVAELGSGKETPEAEAVAKYHDRVTRAKQPLELA
jgi:hypothetical protein